MPYWVSNECWTSSGGGTPIACRTVNFIICSPLLSAGSSEEMILNTFSATCTSFTINLFGYISPPLSLAWISASAVLSLNTLSRFSSHTELFSSVLSDVIKMVHSLHADRSLYFRVRYLNDWKRSLNIPNPYLRHSLHTIHYYCDSFRLRLNW